MRYQKLKDLKYKKAEHEHKRKNMIQTLEELKWEQYMDKFHTKH